jgi:hypothetical protein
MHTTDLTPEVGASAANAGHPRNNEHDNQLLPDPAIRGNCRRLIRSQCGTELWEVFEIAAHFELVSDCETTRFDEFWQALFQQIRLAAKEGAQ